MVTLKKGEIERTEERKRKNCAGVDSNPGLHSPRTGYLTSEKAQRFLLRITKQ